MRQVLIDEMLDSDVSRLKEYLAENAWESEIDGLYWVELTTDILSPDQFEAAADHPFGFAVEVGESWAKFEFLVRSRSNFRSPFTGYATPLQQKFILDYTNRLVEELGLQT